jgi:alpha-tubulin suppressor-like RCC1 family protein
MAKSMDGEKMFVDKLDTVKLQRNMLIEFEYPVKFIDCTWSLSFAVDFNGNAFFWGQTSIWSRIQWKPKNMIIENVKKIQKTKNRNTNNKYECIVLNESGKVFI